MKRWFLTLLTAVCACAACASYGLASESAESPYVVTWTTPGVCWNDTMPIGNGEVAANVYFNGANGTLHMLIARTDAWDDLGRLAKLAEFCVGELPKCGSDVPFTQTLDTKRGLITIEYGLDADKTRLEIWIDPDRAVAVVEIDSAKALAVKPFFYLWRDEHSGTIPAKSAEISDMFWGQKEDALIRPDALAGDDEIGADDKIAVYHRNVEEPYFDEMGKTQGLDEFPGRVNPLTNRTFGCVAYCKNAKRVDAKTLQAPESVKATIQIASFTLPNAGSSQDWIDAAKAILADADSQTLDERKAARDALWSEYAQRSAVEFSPNAKACANDEEAKALAQETFSVTRGYALQRYIVRCHGKGEFPIKFNGGLFTTAPVSGAYGRHDYRRWGPGYWFQNTRLPYYAMLASGDFELMQPFFEQYFNLLPLCEYRVKKYFGDSFQGAYFPECIYFWGDVFPETYGLVAWNEKDTPLQNSRWHRWEWVGGLEICWLALNYYDYTQDEAFLKDRAIPFSLSILKFFDSFYQVDKATGKLHMEPSQACETWQYCVNAAPEVAGLRGVLGKLLALPDSKLSAEDRAYCEALLARTPVFPTRVDEKTGKTMLAPAEKFEEKRNVEAPEMYAVFPFRLYSFEQPNAEWAELAFERRTDPCEQGWSQDDLDLSYLGKREELRKILVSRANNKDPKMRFPAFWGPNFDWTPDQDHGSILCTAVPSAVLQTNGDKIFVNPSCPKEWNAEFKLHAPKNTIVKGKIVDGEVVELNVEPKEREKDVTIVK